MIKHKELSEPYSCLNKAKAEEPIFVLRANDPMAPQTVRHWATMATGKHEPAKIEEALLWAEAAEKWHADNRPPEPPPEPPREYK